MTLHTQKYLRLLIPGMLLYVLLVVFCSVTQWCNLAIPQSREQLTTALAAFALGALYHFTGLRELSNRWYHLDVNLNIVRMLSEPFATRSPSLRNITWKNLRSTFYNFIDHDESLKTKAQIIRFNGLLWTSIADLRVVTILGVLLFSGAIICSPYITILQFSEHRAGIPIFILTNVFLCTFWLSTLATRRHKALSEEQCGHILEHHGEALKARLEQISCRLERAS